MSEPVPGARSAPGLRLAAIALLLLAAAGCSDADKLVQLPPPAITVARPIEREMVDAVYFTGRTDGSEFVEIRARVSGYLSKIDFQPGTFIEKGARLFEIDDRPYQAVLDQSQGELERAQARLKRTDLDLARGETLIARKVITKEEYDRLVADQAEAAAVVHSAAAAAERAKLDLEWTKIDAPISGLVSRELITVGNLVVADQTLLTTILKHDPLYVYFDIDEHTVLRILEMIEAGKFASARTNKLPVRVGLATDEGYPIEGYVNFVENRVDRSSGTMQVRAEVANPLLANGSVRMQAGLFARVRFDLGEPFKALLVSERSLLSDQDKKYVYVVGDDGVVQRRDVTIGQLDDGYRVILKGLQPTDRVVTSGLQKVRPGVTADAKDEILPGPTEDSTRPAPGGTEETVPALNPPQATEKAPNASPPPSAPGADAAAERPSSPAGSPGPRETKQP